MAVSLIKQELNFLKWIANRLPDPQAKMKVFCFPCAGGGASFFRNWHEKFLPGIDFLPVQLPGRENRFKEPYYENLETLINDLYVHLQPLMDRPYAFFGHSMGSLVSFELARKCRAEGNQDLVHLFVSAFRAPYMPYRQRIIHALSDEEFMRELLAYRGIPKEIVNHPEMIAIITPVLKADFKVHENYSYVPQEKLNCPISVLGGTQDDYTTLEELEGWKTETCNESTLQMFPGEHYFIKDNYLAVIEMIKERLAT